MRHLPASNSQRNDSPAVGHCLAGETRILTIDGTTKELRALRVGDLIYGTAREPGGRRRLVRTRVVAHWQAVRRAVRITIGDVSSIVASPEHRFLTNGGAWKPVSQLVVNDHLFGTTRSVSKPAPPIRYARSGNTALADAHPRQCNETFFAPSERYTTRAIEELGFELLMFDITTGTGDFIANGIVSHNCLSPASIR